MKPAVLVVDDDSKTTATVAMYLRSHGFEPLVAHDGETALQMALSSQPSLVVLDVMLPQMNGLAVCAELRRCTEAAIILLTARSLEDDKLRGLESGADDYVTKPFSPRELMARIKAVLRRTKPAFGRAVSTLEFEGLTIDLGARTVVAGGRPLTLTPTEFKLLACLARSPGVAFSRTELVERALGWDYEGMERTVDVHVMNLRKKLSSADSSRPSITTVFGFGYKFEGELIR
ncbi:MAG: response regulator transcription factor [Candidatus Eremiobacteraeota bacterium]|nr:response regulator transcription factor [Candidatus Eremiobacteraeota bacterium]